MKSLRPRINGAFYFMKELVYGPFLEIWKSVKSYEGLYEISNYGRVKTVARTIITKRLTKEGIIRHKKSRILINDKAWFKNDDYYFSVTLFKNGKSKVFVNHRLVAQYIPNPFNLPCVNHINGDKLDLYHTNLEWVSSRENTCHAVNKTKTTSQYIGVSWKKKNSKWVSQISFKGKVLHLGSFNTESEAYQTRCDFEKNNNIINKYL